MKYAIMSDVHANEAAFRAALNDAESRGAGSIVLMGDVVGYGVRPSECVALAREKCKCLLGNHDAGVCGRLSLTWFSDTARNGVERNRGHMSQDERDWLDGLPFTMAFGDGEGKFVCSHGSPAEPKERFDYVMDGYDARMASNEAFSSCGANVMFCGHSHDAEVYSMRFMMIDGGRKRDLKQEIFDCARVRGPTTIEMEDRTSYVFVVGSVGYPRSHYGSTYVIYDTEARTVEYRILRFDYEGYVKDLEDHGVRIPAWLDYRVSKDRKSFAEGEYSF